MNCKFSRWFLILPLITIISCGSKNLEESADNSNQATENSIERPINVVVKEPGKNSELAPIPADTPAIIPPGPVPTVPVVGPPLPPPPIPVGVVVDDQCEDIFCGDGKKQDGEECDDGNNEQDDSCDNFCRKIRCGNGRIEGEEECDNKDHINCTEDCTLSLCGNGEEDEGETCDPPNEATECNPTCLTSVCGNGIVEFGEECDDDNAVETDGCNNACELACLTPPTR